MTSARVCYTAEQLHSTEYENFLIVNVVYETSRKGHRVAVGTVWNIPDVVVVLMNFFGGFSRTVISYKLSKICINIFTY